MDKAHPCASNVRLTTHPTGRNAAVAQSHLPPGTLVASVPPLATCLLPGEKGRRCDGCHSFQSEAVRLRRCSGCASLWYCGTTCQDREWKSHHRRMCKHYNGFVASTEYQALTTHDQVDALLLSQLLADPDGWRIEPAPNVLCNPLATFLDLLKVPRQDGFVPPLCLSRSAQTTEVLKLAEELYSRFGDNNFVLHSHLNPYAHGVYPSASRLFNHSCVPNAACKYVVTRSERVRMEVIGLRDISEDEEITIPYLDPALPYETRQDALRVNYGFQCTCRLCAFQGGIEPVPTPASRGSTELRELDTNLRSFSLGDVTRGVRTPTAPGLFERLPTELYPIFHELYLPALSEQFSKTSHDGPYADAIEAGLTLLAFYVVVYPPNYPQIGMHALELAKTLWNFLCTQPGTLGGASEQQLQAHTKSAIDLAAFVLRNFGSEGHTGGPLEEIRVLSELLDGR